MADNTKETVEVLKEKARLAFITDSSTAPQILGKHIDALMVCLPVIQVKDKILAAMEEYRSQSDKGIEQEKDTIIQQLREEAERLRKALDACFCVMMQPYYQASQWRISVRPNVFNEARARAEKMYYEATAQLSQQPTDIIQKGEEEKPKFECYEILQVRAGNRFDCGEQCEECKKKEAWIKSLESNASEPQQPTNEAGQGASNRNDSNTHVVSNFSESELAADYRNEGYVSYYNWIDAEVAAEDNCEKCGHAMRYIGLKKEDREEFSGQSQVSYIAISHCDNCGNEYEF